MLRNFFLPHHHTHKKAHLLTWQAIAFYIFLFILLKVILQHISSNYPGVLGINSKVDQKALIEITNKQRVAKGLPSLRENQKLNLAALDKAKNMFEENYWAHYSPSGKDPWGFIQAAGYKFSYAGENLARNFYTSEEVVEAWMNSPSHRDNILNSHYVDIGIAVVEGTLKGQKTTLIVQEFGRSFEPVAVDIKNSKITQGISLVDLNTKGESIPSLQLARVDPYQTIKVFGFLIIAFVFALTLLDIIIIKHRSVYRLSSRHLPHLAILSLTAISMMSISSAGQILEGISILR